MNGRYSRNIGAISEDEQRTLATKSVLIVGLGGLGGYSAEFLARMGVGELRLCDCDAFDESNLNRQINAIGASLGRRKTEVAGERVAAINPEVKTILFDKRFEAASAAEMIDGADLIMDALDNVPSRLELEKAASEHGVPLVFGAVSEWVGQVSTILPGEKKLAKLYAHTKSGAPSVLPFAVAAVSAFQSAEAIKVLLGRSDLAGKLLLVDLGDNETYTIDF